MPKPKPAAKVEKQRGYLSQSDVPLFSLEKALKIPAAILDNYGNGPAKPLDVARVLEVSPQSSGFKMQAGAAIAYGFTNGGWNAAQIEVAPLARKILRPEADDEPLVGKREALLKPRVVREFLTKYDNAPIPRDEIAFNVLETLGVPRDRTSEVLNLIMEGATSVGFITEIKGKKYANLAGVKPPIVVSSDDEDEPGEQTPVGVREQGKVIVVEPAPPPPATTEREARLKKVFISHGKNKEFVDPIKSLLKFGQLDAVVSVEKSTVSQPIPQKVMSDMRSCGAAIIHVEGERRLIDPETKEHFALNENVLIEIGAAMALYGERYILLVKQGVTLPSNLQGLYEVRYSGDKLDGEETIKLMGAINDLKTKPLP
ncbi:MAG: TIR domain-containing protein [Candidatus Acidiferrales bacterium]